MMLQQNIFGDVEANYLLVVMKGRPLVFNNTPDLLQCVNAPEKQHAYAGVALYTILHVLSCPTLYCDVQCLVCVRCVPLARLCVVYRIHKPYVINCLLQGRQ